MKIYCEKCGKDITMLCTTNIESYAIGKIKCPDCNTHQKRYISEADILLFFGTNELLYTLFTFVCVKTFETSVHWYTIVILLAMFVSYYFLSKMIASYIYIKAPFKKEIMNKTFTEDGSLIKKNMTWQFMLFFAIAITGLTLESEVRPYFLIILPLIPIISYIKFYFQVKYEKETK